ncbi:hypothetical protein PHSY_007338 [Pseudozyma hubeiensis SY62]|uniref:Uncharacterized protein n=1 Tax=Pseudozyma hubeiensis (strain SY62) TaxID=1305764 RepID=R9PNM7_PSEHS|nr:hypothetical protein PHSY_007338 [Pseudozyma hubeiensis SY62]GAC99735.1 hypothetical protein PHSY_007338 [Pseudozyma hubeiensis SY62]
MGRGGRDLSLVIEMGLFAVEVHIDPRQLNVRGTGHSYVFSHSRPKHRRLQIVLGLSFSVGRSAAPGSTLDTSSSVCLGPDGSPESSLPLTVRIPPKTVPYL